MASGIAANGCPTSEELPTALSRLFVYMYVCMYVIGACEGITTVCILKSLIIILCAMEARKAILPVAASDMIDESDQ